MGPPEPVPRAVHAPRHSAGPLCHAWRRCVRCAGDLDTPSICIVREGMQRLVCCELAVIIGVVLEESGALCAVNSSETVQVSRTALQQARVACILPEIDLAARGGCARGLWGVHCEVFRSLHHLCAPITICWRCVVVVRNDCNYDTILLVEQVCFFSSCSLWQETHSFLCGHLRFSIDAHIHGLTKSWHALHVQSFERLSSDGNE